MTAPKQCPNCSAPREDSAEAINQGGWKLLYCSACGWSYWTQDGRRACG